MGFESLSRLATEPTRVHTKRELLREVWGFKAIGNTRTVDAYACRLRKKLARAVHRTSSRTCAVSATGCRPGLSSRSRALAIPLARDGRAT
jgi:Transcriptional regulatory protein, C terminal